MNCQEIWLFSVRSVAIDKSQTIFDIDWNRPAALRLPGKRFPLPDRYFFGSRHLRYALECRDRGPALLEEFPRLYHVQSAVRRARRAVARDCADDSAVRVVLRAGETAATLAEADD